ncbi:NAD(P)-binding protein [Aspergillus niger ATCC 13496]|uniref:NAD(P)-binding protein n=1 Tax=Aspergillus niger ATCC 13496 TaxID=1353008 RepID=A0A370BVS5_ASPNG|nr:NAD(P)-binding protein [Aspergillus niger ATCC 13496]
MGAQFSQFFPPRPTFTPDDLPQQSGKVVLITGGASGIGFEVAKVLYRKGAKVYIAGRSESAAQAAILAIQKSVPENAKSSTGELHFLELHLDDLTTIKSTVSTFSAIELKLDLLFNNAGVSQPPLGSVSQQGIELQLATNCLGPFLLTQLLTPLLEAAASSESELTTAGSVRVIWTSSQVAELSAPPEGIIMSELTNPPKDAVRNYVTSKLGNWFLSTEMARRYGEKGIVSVAQNPGAANTNLLRNARWMKLLSWPLLHSPALAAHTVLYAGLSGELGLENNGAYVVPWGRLHDAVAPTLLDAMKRKEEGGTGRASAIFGAMRRRTEVP